MQRTSTPQLVPVTASRETDEALRRVRLAGFLRVMFPVAVLFDLAYIASAAWLHSTALAGGAFAVMLYVIAVRHAQKRLADGAMSDAALWTGGALLVMVAVGALFLHFLFAALVMMVLAGVALVLPYVQRIAFERYAIAAFGVTCEVVLIDGVLPAVVEQPPAWFQHIVLVSALLAATGLTIRLLQADHVRLARLLDLARESLVAAETANATKDAFLAAAAHDLRTPLATLRLQAESLVSGPLAGDIADARVKERLARIDRQARRLANLVEGLLDVSLIAAGRLELRNETLDLTALVRECIARMEDEASRAGSEVHVRTPTALTTRGDRVRLDQIVTNLLSNAIKYGGGRPIEVDVEAGGNGPKVIVRDAGIGIATDDQQRIFERFERASAAANYAGLGVGLWIVRELVRNMGGSIALDSQPGRGATFTVQLPRGEVAA